MKIVEKDFIEINFTGKTADGELFDSNLKENLEKIDSKAPVKPFIFGLGQGMFLKGIEDFLIGKELGKYEITLEPKEGFGERDRSLIRMVPLKVFHEKQVRPIAGMMFDFDGRPAKILIVSGGRVTVDFNNPLAGKKVVYNIEVIRKVEDLKEKVNAFNEFLFKKEFPMEIKEKKLILEVDKQLVQLVPMFKEKYKEIFDLDLEAKESVLEKK